MSIYKKLAGQTIIYGLGTIVPRMLNYVILTFYYTRLFSVEQYGVIAELYTYVTFLLILLTYGTETGFFKFANNENGSKVYSVLVKSLFITSTGFIILTLIFKHQIAKVIEYESNANYIAILGCIIGIDAFSTILFAKLRKEEKSKRFAVLKSLNVLFTIVSVLFFYEFLPWLQVNTSLLEGMPLREDVIYVLISNLIASCLILVLLIPELRFAKYKFDKSILKTVLVYSFPLMIAGFAGTINETLDRILLKHLSGGGEQGLYVLGIYVANFRIGTILFIFIQMFRYAVEPFYFNYYGSKDEKVVFARIMRLFMGISIVFIMTILFYLDYIKNFIDASFHEGLNVVPVILVAYLFYGIFFNQSIWYKLEKRTGYAILLTLIGAFVTIIANIFFVRYFSYMASAFGHLIAYFLMMVVSYFLGRKYYRINYNLIRILEYILVALFIFMLQFIISKNEIKLLTDIVSICFIIIYAGYILKREKMLSNFFIVHGSKNSK